MEIILANPRGFCAGVERAIAIVERAIEKFGAPIYVRHEVVHNKYVCDNLRQKGAVFIDDLAAVPSGSTLIFSAHGVSKAVREEATARGLKIFNATCPLVTKVHVEVAKMSKEGRDIIMVGHKGHPEVAGTMGQSPENMLLVETVADVEHLDLKDPAQLSYVTQTTLSTNDAEKVIFALKQRFPAIIGPKREDICYATQNRQDAIKSLATKVDIVLVVGSQTSSNSNRLREVAELLGTEAYLIDCADQIDPKWLEGAKRIGITAGASAPEVLVENVVNWLCDRLSGEISQLQGVEENVTFALPRELL